MERTFGCTAGRALRTSCGARGGAVQGDVQMGEIWTLREAERGSWNDGELQVEWLGTRHSEVPPVELEGSGARTSVSR